MSNQLRIDSSRRAIIPLDKNSAMNPSHPPAIRKFAFFLLVALASAAAAHAQSLPSADAMSKQIHEQGAKTVVDQLWPDDAQWTQLLHKVRSGDPAWLQVAVDINPGASSGALQTLLIAVSQSIQKKPEAFLKIAYPSFGDSVCHNLTLELSDKQIQEFIYRTQTALAHVKKAPLAAARDKCLAALQQDTKQQ